MTQAGCNLQLCKDDSSAFVRAMVTDLS